VEDAGRPFLESIAKLLCPALSGEWVLTAGNARGGYKDGG
jgi:hypothetical protein